MKPSKFLLRRVFAAASVGSKANHWKKIPFCLGSLLLKYAKLLTYNRRTIGVLTAHGDKIRIQKSSMQMDFMQLDCVTISTFSPLGTDQPSNHS